MGKIILSFVPSAGSIPAISVIYKIAAPDVIGDLPAAILRVPVLGLRVLGYVAASSIGKLAILLS